MDAIKCLKQSDGKTYPPSMFPETDRKLKGFLWREDEQPKTKEYIFIKDGKPKRGKLVTPPKPQSPSVGSNTTTVPKNTDPKNEDKPKDDGKKIIIDTGKSTGTDTVKKTKEKKEKSNP
jgi:hypothetical protein